MFVIVSVFLMPKIKIENYKQIVYLDIISNNNSNLLNLLTFFYNC